MYKLQLSFVQFFIKFVFVSDFCIISQMLQNFLNYHVLQKISIIWHFLNVLRAAKMQKYVMDKFEKVGFKIFHHVT